MQVTGMSSYFYIVGMNLGGTLQILKWVGPEAVEFLSADRT